MHPTLDAIAHPAEDLQALLLCSLRLGRVYSLAEGWSMLDAFYFSIMTLTTVGFGDFAPITTFGKIFTAFYVFAGVAIVLTFIDTMGEISVRRRGTHGDRGGYRTPEDNKR